MENRNGKTLEEKASRALAGYLDFKLLAGRIGSLMLEERESYTDVSVFKVESNGEDLRAFTFRTNQGKLDIEKIIGKKFTDLKTPIRPRYLNLMGRTASEGEICEGEALSDFVCPTISKVTSSMLQKITGAKSYLSIPIPGSSGVVGVLFVASRAQSFSDEEKESLQRFSRQIGIAMSNAIAHERIVKKMERQNGFKKRKFDKPNIKFTLRITPRIEKYLSWKIQNTDRTKADYLREEVERLIDEDDEFEKFDEN